MGQLLLVLVVAVIVAAVVLGVTVLVTGRDPGLVPAEPDGQARPLPGHRPLREADIPELRFDTAMRGYRMAQVDQVLRRVAYDIGYKTELIGVLEAEVAALREGRVTDADQLRRARESSGGHGPEEPGTPAAVPSGVTAPGPAVPSGVTAPGSAAPDAVTAPPTVPTLGDGQTQEPAPGTRYAADPADALRNPRGPESQ
ncbi:DivIVA domain-containing protein [Melissospora conviva]|uniref:DivIVA domain-containing protein n=1 Tax=Melissospora conviva TaxID=3388432 RepID=UPI003C252BB1